MGACLYQVDRVEVVSLWAVSALRVLDNIMQTIYLDHRFYSRSFESSAS